MTLEQAGDVVLLIAAGVFGFTAACYWGFARGWWRHKEGWNVMGLMWGIALVLLLNTSAVYFGGWYIQFRPLARFVVYSVMILLGVQRFYWLYKAQIKRKIAKWKIRRRHKKREKAHA